MRKLIILFITLCVVQISSYGTGTELSSCVCKALIDDVNDLSGYEMIKDFSGTRGSIGDDGSSSFALKIPFDFRLFSYKIDSFYVNINGSISSNKDEEYKTINFRDYQKGTFMISPYWSDIYINGTDSSRSCGNIYYKYLINNKDTIGIKILWNEVGFYYNNSDKDYYCESDRTTTFELTLTNGDGYILPKGHNVAFCYKKIGFAIGSASEDVNNQGSSYKDSLGFKHKGTPATVGVVYYDGERTYYYQIGQYDRGGDSVGNRLVDGTYENDLNSQYVTYSGFGELINKSKNCELSYDFRDVCSINPSPCKDGTYSLSIFAAIRNGNMKNPQSKRCDIYIDNKLVYQDNVVLYNFIQLDNAFRLKADGLEHTMKVLLDNSEFVSKKFTSPPPCICPENSFISLDGFQVGENISLCKNKLYSFKFAAGVPMTNPQYEWSWNSESSSSSGSEDSYSLQATQSGRLSVLMTSEECKKGVTVSVDLDVAICFTKKCNDCPSKFSPQPGEKYVISGWVSAPGQLENHATSFEKVGIQMNFSNTSGWTSTFSVAPSGSIIDGWQRISGVVTIPQDAEVMRISLVNESGSDEVYYDDIRFHPFNSTMKGYVYDPVTLRLSAELDDQNYATLYEYDDEGVLVRVKKETERGVMTIRESRQSSRKTKE